MEASAARGISARRERSVYYDPKTDPTRPRYDRPKAKDCRFVLSEVYFCEKTNNLCGSHIYYNPIDHNRQLDLDHSGSNEHVLHLPGEVGITIDVYDAVTQNPKEFHSHHALLTITNDRLYDLLCDYPLEQLKGSFLQEDLLHGIVLQKINRGLILSVWAESPEALEGLWRAQSQDDICRILQQTLITPDILERAGAREMELRVRLWEDERTACVEDLKQMKTIDRTLDKNSLASSMVKKIIAYKKMIPDKIWTLRDEEAKFERDLSEMLRLLKGVMPGNKQPITSLKEYDKCCAALESKPGMNMSPFRRYRDILFTAKGALQDIQGTILYCMYQIHSSYETPKQKEKKLGIRNIITSALNNLDDGFDLSSLRHPAWHNKFLANEERFLGFVSLIRITLDALGDIDDSLDEYMSGFKSQ